MAKQCHHRDDGWRISDEMWNAMEPLLPPPKPTALYTSPARRAVPASLKTRLHSMI